VLLKLGQDRPAYEALHRAHQLNPQDPATLELLHTATLKLASNSQAARQYLDSLRYFEEASTLRPQDPEPHRRMAEIHAALGRPAQAKAEQQKADSLSRASGKVQ
jgi:tetratricopeptide (TPR) repeat protein